MAVRQYSRARQALVLISGSVALTLLLGSLAVSALAAPAQQNINVNVTNPSLAVTQSGSWTVAATQSGTWNVGITGTPTVKSGDTTVVLDTFAGEVAGGGVFVDAAGADVSGQETVRVVTNCFAGAPCGNITVRIYTVVGGRSFLLEQYTMGSFVADTRVLDTPGIRLDVQLINSGSAIDNVGVAVLGRAN